MYLNMYLKVGAIEDAHFIRLASQNFPSEPDTLPLRTRYSSPQNPIFLPLRTRYLFPSEPDIFRATSLQNPIVAIDLKTSLQNPIFFPFRTRYKRELFLSSVLHLSH